MNICRFTRIMCTWECRLRPLHKNIIRDFVSSSIFLSSIIKFGLLLPLIPGRIMKGNRTILVDERLFEAEPPNCYMSRDLPSRIQELHSTLPCYLIDQYWLLRPTEFSRAALQVIT